MLQNFSTCLLIIIAAHCVKRRRHHIKLRFGDWDRTEKESGEEERWVKSVTIHPNYTTGSGKRNLTFDIAILELKDPIDFSKYIQPLCFPTRRPKPRERTFAIGWGETEHTGNNAFLRYAMVPVIDREKCNKFWGGGVYKGQLCAGFKDGHSNICFGDSGGPLVRPTDNGFQLVGIASWIKACTEGSSNKKLGTA